MKTSLALALLLVVAGCPQAPPSEPDSGTRVDAGAVTDAGGIADASIIIDAGANSTPDASVTIDAGTPDPLGIDSFTASLARLPLGGGAVALAWQTHGATRVTLNDEEVTTTTTTVTLSKSTRFTLAASDATHTVTAALVVRVDAPAFTFIIDAGLAPTATLTNPDGGIVPVVASQDARGVVSNFIANELIVSATTRAEADTLAQQLGGTIIDDDEIPEPPPELGLSLSPDERKASRYVIRVDPSTTALDALPEVARQVGLGGPLTFSSPNAAKLATIALTQQVEGRALSLNFVMSPAGVLNATEECSVTSCVSNDFTRAEFSENGSRTDVHGAWQFIAGRQSIRRVRVAIIDSGFWFNMATGKPNTLVGIGHDYPGSIQQYDFDADRRNIGAPNAGDCGGNPCIWHGNGAASTALGVLNNGLAGAGTGGQVADAVLFHVKFNWFQTGHAIRTATRWGVDVVSMSYSGKCNALCDTAKLALDPEGDAVKLARRTGLVLIAAAGNEPIDVNDKDVEPCTLDGIICVGALANGTNNRISYSGSGASVDIWAPTNLLAVYSSNQQPTVLEGFGGTSASTPFIAGIAAMMRSVNPNLNSDQVRDVMRSTGHPASTDSTVTHSINAHAAVRAAGNHSLGPDALEAPGSVLPSGRVDNLSIDTSNDRDDYAITVSEHVNFAAYYDEASRLGSLKLSLRKTKGCGAIGPSKTGVTPGPLAEKYYAVAKLTPGEYLLSAVAFRRDRPTERDLTAYWLEPQSTTLSDTVTSDDYEPNNTQAQATSLVRGLAVDATLHLTDDVDAFRVKGEGLETSGPLTLDSYFSIPATDGRLRLTLYSVRGEATGVTAESDAFCAEPLGIHVPEGDYVVMVERIDPAPVRYQASFGKGIAGVYVPHAPLRWEARKGIQLKGISSDDAIGHLYLPDGQSQLVQLLADGIDLSLVDATGALVDRGISLPGFDGIVLPLSKATTGQPFFIELTRTQPGLSGTGKQPGLEYTLNVQ